MREKDPERAIDRPTEVRPHDKAEREPKPAFRPAPGVKHVPEPDAENIMPAEDEPGTL